jgi:hypothetical protein
MSERPFTQSSFGQESVKIIFFGYFYYTGFDLVSEQVVLRMFIRAAGRRAH